MSAKATKILIVDDDRLLREFYSRVFENLGHEVVCAGDGQQAIDFLENSEGTFALVLMDLLMPVKTGWEVIDHIRANPEWHDLPVVAVTGASMSKDERARIQRQCDEVISKAEFEMKTFERLVLHYVEGQGDAGAVRSA